MLKANFNTNFTWKKHPVEVLLKPDFGFRIIYQTKFSEMNVMKFSEEWIASWNSHNIEKIMAHYSDHVVFTCPYISRFITNAGDTLIGKDLLREYFAQALAEYPELKFELQMISGNSDNITLYYKSVKGTMAIENMKLNNESKVIFGKVEYKYFDIENHRNILSA